MRTGSITQPSGAISSARFAAPIAISTVPYRFRESMFATWRDGMRKSIPMKILQRRLPSGSRHDRSGASATQVGPLSKSCSTSIALREKSPMSNHSGDAAAPISRSTRWKSTVGDFYRLTMPEEIPLHELALDTDLADIFNASPKRRKGVRAAHEMLREHRKPIIDKVAYWSGVQRPIVKRLVEAICKRVEELDLRVDVCREADHLMEFTVYTTALSMNYLVRGKFIHP